MKDILKYLTPIIVFSLTILTVFFARITTPTYKMNDKLKRTISTIVPQHWYFFTKSAKENSINCYKILKNDRIEQIDFHNSSFVNVGGINRRVRCIGAEITSLQQYIPDSIWHHSPSNKIISLDSIKTLFLNKHLINYLDTNFVYLYESKIKKPWLWSSDTTISVNRKLVRIKFL